MAYKHGVYGELTPYAGKVPGKSSGTVPVYIGTAPIHLSNKAGEKDFDYSKKINTPILLSSYEAAKEAIGYSSEWKNYTLCEAVAAHFLNSANPIGPILVINMADPSQLESQDTVEIVTLSGANGDKKGYLNDSLAAIENIAISATPSLTAGDYELSYEDDKILIHIKKEGFSAANVTATYKKIDVSEAAVSSSKFGTAVEKIDLCESITGIIPNIIAAPGFSEKPDYHKKMTEKATKRISQKWGAVCVSDIPADSSVNTPELAIAWKQTNGYDNTADKICFPMQKYNGEMYHLSTLTVVTMQYQDNQADGVPYITPSNKVIASSQNVLADGTAIYFDEVTANKLNEKGITTTNIIKGAIRLWGSHMSNYDYDKLDSIQPEDRQDSSVRMMRYLVNTLQYEYIDEIDRPYSRRDIDSILISVQQWLNSLINQGKILHGTISFKETSNPESSLVDGDFVFDVETTTTPNGKSITFKVQYSLTGLSTLTSGGEE